MNSDSAPRSLAPVVVANVRVLPTSPWASWLFAIGLFGYPIVGSSVSFLHVDSRILSIPFRVAVALISVWVIMLSRPLRLDGFRIGMLAIWLIYGLRLIHDIVFARLEGADFALQFFLVSSVLPTIALMKSGTFARRRFVWKAFVLASVGCVTSLAAWYLGTSDTQDVAEQNGRLGLGSLDPVSLGYLAASAVACSLVLWRDAGAFSKLAIASIQLILLWCLVLTGSKGPALALVFCVGLWALRNGLAWKFALLAVPLVALIAFSDASPLANRLSGSGDDPSTAEHFVLILDSVDQILASPILGSAFVEQNSGFYPHNVVIEAALAMGIPAAIFFVVLLVVAAWRAWHSLLGDYDVLGLLFFQSLLAALTSGALFGAITLWVSMAILPPAKRLSLRVAASN